MPDHLRPVPHGEGVAVHCAVCGATCPVPGAVDVGRAMQLLVALHPARTPHEPACPAWEG